ncbi:LuxR C-terminal-related transcriptional regulator [Streptomyces sp. NPDC006649]|uniref:ATP-binding protein n=1 Tax=Streptomyces sp. NPDC006649 TaxID=3156896 RepID=UPI0033A972B2
MPSDPLCETCGNRLAGPAARTVSSRPSRYCSNACRQQAYRRRRKTRALPAQPLVGLCAHVSSFHGREDDLLTAARLISSSRLLTIVGEPGVGKTRLVVELLKRLSRRKDTAPAFHVDIGALDADAAVAAGIATAAGLADASSPPVDSVIRAFGTEQDVLLALDNCEHRLEECGKLLAVLLPQCPRLRVLATSREVLRLPGEVVHSLRGLPVLAGLDGAALRLFLDRARAAGPGAEYTGPDLDTVDEICARLDGNALAIELAAALVRVLSPSEILDRLAERFSLLDSGWRTADPRHRSLGAAIDWSYQRLTPGERAVLGRISVLPGGFGLGTAAAVCAGLTPVHGTSPGAAFAVLPVLRALEAQSLLVAERGAASTARFRLTESVRLFARARPAGERARRAAEGGLVAALAELADPLGNAIVVAGPDVARLVEERDSLLRALHLLDGTGDERRLVLALAVLTVEDADGAELGGRRALADALRDTPAGSRHRGAALATAALLASEQGDACGAARLARATALTAWRDGDERGLARYLRVRGTVGAYAGDLPAAVADAACALRISARLEDEAARLCCTSELGWYLLGQGDVEAAADAVRIAGTGTARGMLGQAPHAPHVPALFYTAGAVELRRGNVNTAGRHFTEGLALGSAGRAGVPWGLEGAAAVAVGFHRPERTLRLLGAADGLRERTGSLAPHWWRRAVAETRTEGERYLSGSRADSALRAGRSMSGRQAVDYALGESPSAPNEPRKELSSRERQVVGLVARGMTNREIAERLSLSVRTVETHTRHIRERFGLRSRAHLAAWSAGAGRGKRVT